MENKEASQEISSSEVFELAARLGETLKLDTRLVRLSAAKLAYESDETLQAYLREYQVDQEAIREELVKEQKDMLLVDSLQSRTEELYRMITSAESFLEVNRAQEEVNALMDAVNTTIQYHVTGEMPACTHHCSTCKSGCHS